MFENVYSFFWDWVKPVVEFFFNYGLFSIPYKWLWYSTYRHVEISFLGMPQIAHFQVEKLKSSLPWEGDPPPTPFPRSVTTLPRKDCALPPPNVLAHYATGVMYHNGIRHCNRIYFSGCRTTRPGFNDGELSQMIGIHVPSKKVLCNLRQNRMHCHIFCKDLTFNCTKSVLFVMKWNRWWIWCNFFTYFVSIFLVVRIGIYEIMTSRLQNKSFMLIKKQHRVYYHTYHIVLWKYDFQWHKNMFYFRWNEFKDDFRCKICFMFMPSFLAVRKKYFVPLNVIFS